METEDAMAREKRIWTDLFANQFNVDSAMPPLQKFVNDNFAHPLSCRMIAFVEFKDAVKERVKEFKKVPVTPKKKRQDRADYKYTLEEFAGNLQKLNMEDSEIDEIMEYEDAPEAHQRSETRTPDLDVRDKKKSKSVFPTSATPKLPPSTVRASRVRVGSVTRTPVTRSMAARMANVGTPLTSRNPHLTSTPGGSRVRTTNERRKIKEESEMKLECASVNRDERLREEVERKRREREDRERRVQLNLKEKQRLEEEKHEKRREHERLVEQLRLEQLNATKRNAASPARTAASPGRAVASPGRSRLPGKSNIPRFERPTAASKAKLAPTAGPVAKLRKHGEQHETASKLPIGLSAASSMESVFSAETKSDPKEIKKRAAEEAKRLRQKQKEEASRLKKLAKEEATRKKLEEEERKRAVEEARKKAAEEERERIIMAEQRKKAAEEERKRAAAAAEEERKIAAAAAEEARRKAAKEAERQRIEEEQRRLKEAQGALKTPLQPKNTLAATEYEMTPDKVFKESTATNYNIEDLSSGDETDDDENPRKKVPSWAQPSEIIKAARLQDYSLADLIFPPMVVPDLATIFHRHPSRYPQRSSSAHWQSPLDDPKIGRSRLPLKRKLQHSESHL